MAVQTKLTIARGKTARFVTSAAGTPGAAGTDTIELNLDVTTLKKGEALILVEELRRFIQEHKWAI